MKTVQPSTVIQAAKAAIKARNSEAGERNAVMATLARYGYAKLPQMLKGTADGGAAVRMYVWEGSLGDDDLVLVTGPSIEGEIHTASSIGIDVSGGPSVWVEGIAYTGKGAKEAAQAMKRAMSRVETQAQVKPERKRKTRKKPATRKPKQESLTRSRAKVGRERLVSEGMGAEKAHPYNVRKIKMSRDGTMWSLQQLHDDINRRIAEWKHHGGLDTSTDEIGRYIKLYEQHGGDSANADQWVANLDMHKMGLREGRKNTRMDQFAGELMDDAMAGGHRRDALSLDDINRAVRRYFPDDRAAQREATEIGKTFATALNAIADYRKLGHAKSWPLIQSTTDWVSERDPRKDRGMVGFVTQAANTQLRLAIQDAYSNFADKAGEARVAIGGSDIWDETGALQAVDQMDEAASAYRDVNAALMIMGGGGKTDMDHAKRVDADVAEIHNLFTEGAAAESRRELEEIRAQQEAERAAEEERRRPVDDRPAPGKLYSLGGIAQGKSWAESEVEPEPIMVEEMAEEVVEPAPPVPPEEAGLTAADIEAIKALAGSILAGS